MIRFAALFCCLLTIAAAERPLRLPHEAIDLPVDGSVTWRRLANGLHVAVMANNEPKDQVSMRLYVRAGSIQETEAERGIAHYLEHMAFNGSENWQPGELVKRLQEIGVAFGQQFNAHTGFEETVYKLDLPDVEPANIDLGLSVLAEVAARLTLPEAEIDRERGVIRAEMRDRDTPGLRRALKLYSSLFKDTRIAQRFPIGVAETVDAFDRVMMETYYRRWYRPDRMVLSVVGAIDQARIDKLVDQHFGGLPAGEGDGSAPGVAAVSKGGSVVVHRDEELTAANLTHYQIRPEPVPLDSASERIANVHRALATAIFSRRLADLAESDGSPILRGSMGLFHGFEHFIAQASVDPKPGMTSAAAKVLEQELRRILTHGVTAGELATVVGSRLAQRQQAVERVGLRTNKLLSSQLYTSIRDDQVFQSPQQVLAFEEPVLAGVTPADIDRVLKAAWSTPTRSLLFLGGPEEWPEDFSAKLGTLWNESAAILVAPPAEVAVDTWAYARTTEHESAAKVDLPHGIVRRQVDARTTAVVLARDAKPNEVLVEVTLPFAPSQRPLGVDQMAGMSWMGAALGKHDAAALRRLMASHPIRINGPAIADDHLVFSANCPPNELGLTLEWIRALIVDPGWREDVFDRQRTRLETALAGQVHDLNWQVNKRWAMLTTGPWAYRRQLTEATARSLSMADVRAWIEPILAAAPIEVAVVGDVEADATLAAIGRVFGDAKAAAPAPVQTGTVATASLSTGTYTFTMTGSVDRTVVRIAWPTDDTVDIKFRRRMAMLGQVVDEVLREDVREALGQAYSPWAGHRGSEVFDGEGFLMANIAVAPGLETKVLEVLDGRLAELRDAGIPAEMFERLRIPTIKGLPTYRETNRYWLGSVVSRSTWRPQQFGWADHMESDYAAITVEEVTELLRRYLTADRLVLIGTSRQAAAEQDETEAAPAQAE